MIQVLWKGRGGQGAFTAARLLGAAWVLKGGYALAFPSFGPERRGAPVRAFTKLDDNPVVDRSEITAPDFTLDLINPPAEALALAEQFRLPTVNTVLLGQLASQLGIEITYLEQAIEQVMPEKLWERNKHAIKKAAGQGA
ncbi:MAG: 2-oxoacid:acceptor oxidoreductase family protein [Oscillospiraceae bacterium]|jgi:pyruvate ferredoxin oxidoreductase gamma subunit|nr:2-oxoacid:acceptor oxidoreductase family protein [Oscillospiraceae bacterium]